MGNPYAPPGEGSRERRPAQPDGREPGVGGPAIGDRPPAGDGGVAHPGDDPGGDEREPELPAPPPAWPPGPGPDGLWPPASESGPGPVPAPGFAAGQPGPVGAAHESPGRPQPSPEVARATSRRVLHFLTLLLAAVLTSALPLPWQVGSILFVAAAIVVGIRAFVLAWRSGVRGGLAVMLGVGVVLAAFVALGMLSLLALWPQQVQRQECLARAVTIATTRACEVEFQRAVDERLGGAARRGTGSA